MKKKNFFSLGLCLVLAFFSFNHQLVAECISGPSQLDIGEVGVYTYTVGGSGFEWNAYGGLEIISQNDKSVTVKAIDCGVGLLELTYCGEILSVKGTLEGKSESCCDRCVLEIDVPVEGCCLVAYDCCFDFWVTPKWFPDCFGECTGNWDNVVELHQKPCEDSNLPFGYKTYITGLEVLSPASINNNCRTCDDPITSLPNGISAAGVNIALCAPYNHSVLVDISIVDPEGNVVFVCKDLYYSFEVDLCPDDPFFPLLDPNEGAKVQVSYDGLAKRIQVSSEEEMEIGQVSIYDVAGRLVKSIDYTNGNVEKEVRIEDVKLNLGEVYIIQMLDKNNQTILVDKIIGQ